MGWGNYHITMKYLNKLLVIGLMLVIVACNNAQGTEGVSGNGIIEVVAPRAMYDVLKDQTGAQLIDVRTDKEFGASHLKNAQNICVTDDDFKQKVTALDKNKPVYVYCKKGGRSARAAKVLKEMGFTKIYDLQGGITAWDKNNLETQK